MIVYNYSNIAVFKNTPPEMAGVVGGLYNAVRASFALLFMNGDTDTSGLSRLCKSVLLLGLRCKRPYSVPSPRKKPNKVIQIAMMGHETLSGLLSPSSRSCLLWSQSSTKWETGQRHQTPRAAALMKSATPTEVALRA